MEKKKCLFNLTEDERKFLAEKGNGNMNSGIRTLIMEAGFVPDLSKIECFVEEGEDYAR